MADFRPHRVLRNPHLMTVAAFLWRRKYPQLPPSETRLFEVEQGTRVRAECNWQENRHEHATMVLLHGLEGSSESGYVVGTAEQAFVAGFNVVRLNQRNCGGTDDLTPTVYHSGLSGDMKAVIAELIARDGLNEIFAVGFSMGGNLVLKMAGEMGESAPVELRGVVAVAPALKLAACVDALGERRNFFYERHFVRRLKARIGRKARYFPETYTIPGVARVRTVREYDDVVTAPLCGFRDASDYYARCSAAQWLEHIAVPTVILAAEDDPIVPFGSIAGAGIEKNPQIRLKSTKYGGHCAFISDSGAGRFWSDREIVSYCEEMRARRPLSTVAGTD